MMRPPSKKTLFLPFVLAGALALSACSTFGDPQEPGSTGENGASTATTEADGVVFQFEDFSAGPAQEITVTVPDDLLEAAGFAASDLLAPTVTIRAHELETAQACAVDLVHTYSDGVLASANADGLAVLLGRETTVYTGDESEGTREKWTGARFVDELNASDPEEGYYFSDDLKTVTIVTECAASPSDVDRIDTSDNRISFRPVDQSGFVPSWGFASVAFNVMRDGTVTLVSPEVDGFIRDANGYWIAD